MLDAPVARDGRRSGRGLGDDGREAHRHVRDGLAVDHAAHGARAVGLEVEVRGPLELLRRDADVGHVVDREHAHVGARVVEADEIDAAVGDDEAVGVHPALRAHAVLVGVAEGDAPALALRALQLFEHALDGVVHGHGLEPDRQRRMLHRGFGAPVARAQQLLRRLFDRGRERAAERGAQALERDEPQQLAVREVQPAQAVARGEPVRPRRPVEEPREAGVGEHAEVPPQRARAGRIFVRDLPLELLEREAPFVDRAEQPNEEDDFGFGPFFRHAALFVVSIRCPCSLCEGAWSRRRNVSEKQPDSR